MGIFSGMLLASDFDGTLTNRMGKIPPRNIESIKYFIREGGLFTVSTGRTKGGFHNYSEEFINAPVLLGNGSMAYDYKNEKTAFLNCIGIENISILNQIIKENDWLGTEIYSEDGRVYVINKNEENIRHFNGVKIPDVEDATEFCEDHFPLVKVMFSAGDRSIELQRYLDTVDLNNCRYIPTAGSFVELHAEDSGKGKALLQLADYLGIDRKFAFCIGDGSNDTDMLKAAEFSFCPENGDILAINSADKIVCSSDDGCVADAVNFIKLNFT